MVEFDKNTLTIDNIFTNRFKTPEGQEIQCLVFEWGCNLGFGQYTLYFDHKDLTVEDGLEDCVLTKVSADSEFMDMGNNKEFLKALLDKLIDMVEVEDQYANIMSL